MDAPELRRSLGLTSAISIVVGGVIGSGIFLKPLDVARSLPGAGWIFACWIGLGVVCLFGAFAYAELGALLPEAGGQYAFLREAWGRFPAFLYGWCLFLVINTGTMAALAVAFARSLAAVVPLSGRGEVAVAAAMILGLALVNHFGVGAGAALQNLSTFTKLAALAAIVAGAFLVAPRAAPAARAAAPALPELSSGLVVAAMAIFWAYEGWYLLPFSAAELRDPERTLPRGLILGTLALIAVYVGVNAAYLRVVPLVEMRALERDIDVPLLAIERMLGGPSANVLALLMCLSALGAANPNLLSTPRAFYAMAQDGLLLRAMMRVHPTWRTPTLAIWSQAVWAVALVVVLERFRDITEFVIFAALLFYALTVAAVFVLRRKLPERPRPYSCWGYPWAPALFILVVLLVDVRTLMDPVSRRNSLLGLLILAAGAVAYAAVRWRARRGSDELEPRS
jgi:APA family basic amino acid/polyamine antiporter